jgi:hypothetical protein
MRENWLGKEHIMPKKRFGPEQIVTLLRQSLERPSTQPRWVWPLALPNARIPPVTATADQFRGRRSAILLMGQLYERFYVLDEDK